jgi:hypothetical protein
MILKYRLISTLLACLSPFLWGQQPSLRSTEQRVALTIVSDLAAEGSSRNNWHYTE